MRIRVFHHATYRYDTPAKSLIQVLRVTPRNHDGQFVVHWRIEMDVDGLLKPGEDAFANLTHLLSVPDRVERLVVSVSGEVETHDTTGMVFGTVERFPPELFMRETELTRCDSAIAALACAAAADGDGTPLGALHALMARVHALIALDGEAAPAAGAPEALAAAKGPARDLAHVFVAACRRLAIPCRFVSGYLCRDGEARGLHAWAEAMVPGYGWIAFDPSLNLCPVGGHVRLAVGLDYWGAAPVRGTRYGGGNEQLDVRLRVEARDQAGRQAQN